MFLIWPASAACFASLPMSEASSLLHKARASAAQILGQPQCVLNKDHPEALQTLWGKPSKCETSKFLTKKGEVEKDVNR